EAPATLHTAPLLRNPGSPSAELSALRRTFDVLGTVKSSSLVELGSNGRLAGAAAAIRARVRAAVARDVAPLSIESAGILTAILIGDRTGLDDDAERRLQLAGTYHVIAISGGNIAILTAVCLGVFRVLTRSHNLRCLVTMAVVVAYGVIVGGQPS